MPHPNVKIKDNDRYRIVERLLWIDMEMTGLDPETDRVVEVAAIVTDLDFNILGKVDIIFSQTQKFLKLMHKSPWHEEHFNKNGLFKKIEKSKISLKEGEDKLLKFIDKYFEKDIPIILAGNTIHQDRRFIVKQMKKLENRLHYRMLDVSSFKILFSKKYNKSFEHQKMASHLALEDISESIKELEFYTSFIKKK